MNRGFRGRRGCDGHLTPAAYPCKSVFHLWLQLALFRVLSCFSWL